MDLKDRKKTRWERRFWTSVQFAFEGIKHVFKAERNFRVHVLIAVIVLANAFYFRLSALEWIFILLSIFGVFVLELINSAIERVVDLIVEDYHPLAKQAKDIGAATVLVYAVMTVIIGFIIFLPKIIYLFK